MNELDCFSSLETRIWPGAAAVTSQIHNQGVMVQIPRRGGISLDSSTQKLLVRYSHRGLCPVRSVSPGPWEVHRL